MIKLKPRAQKLLLVGSGVAFTATLIAWWWLFAWRLLSQLESSDPRLLKGSRMLLYEGGTVFFLLGLGGLALAIYVYRDASRHERWRLFFASFSHDLKTSLARLRLQGEVLLENQPSPELYATVSRLVTDLNRLDLHLENSLLAAAPGNSRLMLENLSLSQIVSLVRAEFPELEVILSEELTVHADRRAVVSILRNLFSNAQQHGQADAIHIGCQKQGSLVALSFEDNGKGTTESLTYLGQFPLFAKNEEFSRRGTGMGLYLCRVLVQRMGGSIHFQKSERGFIVDLTLPFVPSQPQGNRL